MIALIAVSVMGKAQDLSRYTFEGAGGVTLPMGSAQNRLNTGYNFLVGGGVRLNPAFSVLGEFQFDHFSLNNQTLQAYSQPDGFSRYWSLTLNPRYTVNPKGKVSAYGTAGYGLYSRNLSFTDPSQAVGYCDPYYGYCDSTGAPVIASFITYKAGYNVGGGLNYALGESGLKIFTDVRYNRMFARANNSFLTLSFGVSY